MRLAILIGLLLLSLSAEAYVGPGLGLGVLGVLAGAVLAVVLALVGVVWYPLKRLMRKLKGEQPSAARAAAPKANERREQQPRSEDDRTLGHEA